MPFEEEIIFSINQINSNFKNIFPASSSVLKEFEYIREEVVHVNSQLHHCFPQSLMGGMKIVWSLIDVWITFV